MKARDIMTGAPLTCTPHTNLAEVVQLMWQGDCGIVPIVDGRGTILGVVTDRDIAIAAATRDRAPSEIRAGELVGTGAVYCRPDDDVATALKLMSDRRVRRLPVIAPDGSLVGVLAMNDIILEAVGKDGVTADQVIEVLKTIGTHHHVLAGRPAQMPVAARKGSPRSGGSARALSLG